MTSDLRTSITLLAGAPTIWMAYFWLVYLVTEVDCRFGATGTTAVTVTLAASVVAAAATGWLTWRAWRLLQTGDFNSALSLAGLLIGAISTVAVTFVGVTAVVIIPC